MFLNKNTLFGKNFTNRKSIFHKKGKQMRTLFRTITLFCSFVYSFAETKMPFALDWKFPGPSAPYFTLLIKVSSKQKALKQKFLQVKVRDATPVATGAFLIGFADINSVVKFTDKNPGALLPAI